MPRDLSINGAKLMGAGEELALDLMFNQSLG